MQGNSDIVLSVKNVSKCFEMYEKPVHRLYQTLCAGKKKFYKEFWALRDISFDVHRGECVGIIGRNGAGKSTLLQIITGTLAPTGGSVSLKGRVAALLELGSGFYPEFTGRENVYLNGSIRNSPDMKMSISMGPSLVFQKRRSTNDTMISLHSRILEISLTSRSRPIRPA